MAKKILAMLLALVMAISVLSACSTTPASQKNEPKSESTQPVSADNTKPATEKDTYRVLCLFRLGDNFGAWLKSAFESEAAKYGNLELTVLDDEMSADIWMRQMENAITDGYDYVLGQIPVCDGSEICQQALDAGIKLMDINMFQDWTVDYMTSVVVSDYDLGASIAEVAAERLPENANIVILNGEPGIPPTLERRQAFQEKLLDVRPDITLLDEQTANFQKDVAMTKTDDWLQIFPQIDGFICASDSMALGAMESCTMNGKDISQIQFYGLDGLADACEAIINGQMTASGSQDATEYARIAIDLIQQDINGQLDLSKRKANGHENGFEDKYVFDVVLIDETNAQKQYDYFKSIGAVQ